MQDFKVVFFLRKNRVKHDGTVPVYIRLRLNKMSIDAGSTGVYVKEDEWNAETQRCKGKSTQAMVNNKKLDGYTYEYMDIFRRLEYSDDLSLETIRDTYQGKLVKKKKGARVIEFFDEYLKNSKEGVGVTHSARNHSLYVQVRNRFAKFLQEKYRKKDIFFDDLTYDMIQKFEMHLRFEGLHINTVMKRMRVLKTMVLNAIKLGKLEKNPFLGYKISYAYSDRGFLTDKEIQTLMQKEFDIPRVALVRDLFIFSCFTGLAYIDVCNLTEDNIVELDGKLWLMTKRQKTDVPSNVLLLDVPQRIIKKYNGQDKKGRLLPVYSNQRLNTYLKEIADICGIKKKLTFHLARHTFATMCISKGVPIESVSKMLGHTSIKTTQIYATITNKKIEQDMMDLAKKLEGFDEKAVV